MNDLVIVTEINPVEVFSNKGLDPVLEKITKEVEAFIPDTTTAKGRSEIASMAYRVAESKTLLDNLGKDLVSEWKEKSKAVDNERRRMRDYLDNLKEKVRKPLTEFEEKEKQRIRNLELRFQDINLLKDMQANCSAETKVLIEKIESILIDESWEEFANRASIIKDMALNNQRVIFQQQIEREKELEELQVLRKRDEERKRQDYEDRIKKEAADRARREAEEKAKFEADKNERERLAAIKAKEDAEKRAIEAERRAIVEKLEAEDRAKKQREDAEKQKLEAVKKERERVESENRKNRELEMARMADIEHRRKINNQAGDAIIKLGFGLEEAKAIVTAIAVGDIPNVKIFY